MPANLDYYRKQAKALLKAAKNGDAAALERLSRCVQNFNPGLPALHEAQFTIAREQGFPSWPRFRAFLVESSSDDPGRLSAFLDASLSDLRRAREMLAAYPQLASAGFYAALVLGESEQVERALTDDRALVRRKGGPKNYEPLAYACFSRFANPASGRAERIVETARTLLRGGADPSTAIVSPEWPDSPLSCLYAAAGLNNNPALAHALLQAGANPNDSESLYHSTEHKDLVSMKLLLRYGAVPKGTNALKHILDREDLEGLRLLLDAGADPNELNHRDETALHWAVWRGRSAEAVAALLDHGADIDVRRKDGRTAYALAVRMGDRAVAALLAGRGANTDLSPADRLLGGCTGASTAEPISPEIVVSAAARSLLPDLAMSRRASAVRALLAAGVPTDGRGELGATALHWACWKGYAEIVEILLSHGASLDAEDSQYHGTPAGWFIHGVNNNNEDFGDYPQVARLLIAAGTKIPSENLPTGHPDVDQVLREHGLIEDGV